MADKSADATAPVGAALLEPAAAAAAAPGGGHKKKVLQDKAAHATPQAFAYSP